jgi:hypothetical protein
MRENYRTASTMKFCVMQSALAPMKVRLQGSQPDGRPVANEGIKMSVAAAPPTRVGRIDLGGILDGRSGDNPSFGVLLNGVSKLHLVRAVHTTLTSDRLGDLWRLMMIVAGVVLTIGWTAGLSWLLLSLLLLVF